MIFDVTAKSVNAIAIAVSNFWTVKSYKKFEIDNLRNISPPPPMIMSEVIWMSLE